jgi:hypothetical protein
MKKTGLILFLLICCNLASAQLVQVSGFIYQKGDSSVALPHVSIINKKTRTGTQSSVDGFYTLLMSPGDTAKVSLVGYKDARFTLPQGITASSYHKNIYLKDDVVLLPGHTVFSITWEKFKESFASIEIEEEKVYITMDNRLNDRTPVNADPHIALNGPISWLYNKLGKKAKEQEKLQELREGSNPEMEYTRRITNQYVMNATQLPEEHVNAFLAYCYSDPYFYAYSTDYDIKTKFLTCLPGFKQKNNISDPANGTINPPVDSLNTKP